MNNQTLTETLRSLEPSKAEWKFALYSVKKSRDGLELEWNICRMKGIADWVETLRTTFLEKCLPNRTVQEYSPFLSDKECISALKRKDSAIREQITDTLLNIKNGLPNAPEVFLSDSLPKPSGFAFYGEIESDKVDSKPAQILFMKRGNPFINGGKTRLCISNGSDAVYNDKPVLKFTPAVDFILIGDVCYFNSSAIEKDLNMENRHLAIAVNRLEIIAASEIAGNLEKLESVGTSVKNAKKFVSFDEEILEHITNLSIVEREEFLSTYGITVDHKGLMDTSDSEQCELIIDLLCGRSVVDPLGRLAIGNVTLRE